MSDDSPILTLGDLRELLAEAANLSSEGQSAGAVQNTHMLCCLRDATDAMLAARATGEDGK